MVAFPEVLGPPSTYSRSQSYQSRTSRFGKGVNGLAHHVVYRKWLRPRFYFNLTWDHLTDEQITALDTFVRSVSGIESTFDWVDWKPEHWMDVPVAVGADNNTFDLPAKDTSNQEFMIDGYIPVVGTVEAGAGVNGQDRVTLVSPVPSGSKLTADFFGRRVFTVSFLNEPPEYEANVKTETFSVSTVLVSAK